MIGDYFVRAEPNGREPQQSLWCLDGVKYTLTPNPPADPDTGCHGYWQSLAAPIWWVYLWIRLQGTQDFAMMYSMLVVGVRTMDVMAIDIHSPVYQMVP